MSANLKSIYYNTSPEPIFFEGTLIGGHEYVYIEGYTRLPGQFVKLDDPKDDPAAPETYKRAYAALTEKAEEEREEVHPHSPNRRTNVVTEKRSKSTPTRKGKRDSSSDDEADQ